MDLALHPADRMADSLARMRQLGIDWKPACFGRKNTMPANNPPMPTILVIMIEGRDRVDAEHDQHNAR